MNYLERLIEDKCVNKSQLANKYQVDYSSLRRWIEYKNIDYTIKFLQMIKFLEADIDKLLKDYEQQKGKD